MLHELLQLAAAGRAGRTSPNIPTTKTGTTHRRRPKTTCLRSRRLDRDVEAAGKGDSFEVAVLQQPGWFLGWVPPVANPLARTRCGEGRGLRDAGIAADHALIAQAAPSPPVVPTPMRGGSSV